MTPTTARWAKATLALLALTACGHQTVTASPRSAPQPDNPATTSGPTPGTSWPSDAAITATPVPSHRDYGTDVHIDPPLATTPPALITAAQALALCNTVAFCQPGVPSQAEFGLFTDDSYGPLAAPVTQTQHLPHLSDPSFVKLPSIILTWHDIPCSGGGRAAGWSTPTPAPSPRTCDLVTAVDAQRGTYELAIQAPSP